MFKHSYLPSMLVLAALLAAAPDAAAQGKGKGRDQADKPAAQKSDKPDRGRARAAEPQRGKGKQSANDRGQERGKVRTVDRDVSGRDAASSLRDDRRSSANKFRREVRINEFDPKVRSFAASSRAPERLAAAAVGIGMMRGVGDNDVVIRRNGDRVMVQNRSGATLIDLDDRRARDLGYWRVDPWDDDVRSGAPAFCRSGEGHPVWGREWCFDKGFGVGGYRDLRWGRTTDIGDIIFGRSVDRGTLARAMLIGVLGDVVFNRLGLHALTLGYTDPLTGVWLYEPTGPQVLRVSSGAVPIAEFYDADRDNRADVLVVALRPW